MNNYLIASTSKVFLCCTLLSERRVLPVIGVKHIVQIGVTFLHCPRSGEKELSCYTEKLGNMDSAVGVE